MKKITLLFTLLSTIVFCQNYSIDTTFNPSDTGLYQQYIGFKGTVLNNGKILSIYNDIIINSNTFSNIIRLNIDGSIDNTFPSIKTPYSMDGLFANKELGNFMISYYDQTTNKTNLQSYDRNGRCIQLINANF